MTGTCLVRALCFPVTLVLSMLLYGCSSSDEETVKVAVLHSLTGNMAISEAPLVDAVLLAVDEINASGGLLGRQVEPLVADGRSDPSVFAELAEEMIVREGVKAVFGCWTSACRKTIKPIVERHDNLLFYPLQYEGLEQSANIVYTGTTPNQQMAPALGWAVDNLGPRVYLAASDYIFPRAANEQLRQQISVLGGEVVGEQYLPLGCASVDALIDEIVAARPDVVLNTINGSSNLAFFRRFHHRGLKIPVLSFSLTEHELLLLQAEKPTGHYAAWNYFQSLPLPRNKAFVDRIKQRYGAHRATNAPMASAYSAVHLWSTGVKLAGTAVPSAVRNHLRGLRYAAPGGDMTISHTNNHTWQPLYLGRIRADGQFEVVWAEPQPMRPMPFPPYRSRAAWDDFLIGLTEPWGGAWSASPDSSGR